MLPGDETPFLEWAIVWITGFPDRGGVGGDTGDTRSERWTYIIAARAGGDVLADFDN
jgi:hypothetical protein